MRTLLLIAAALLTVLPARAGSAAAELKGTADDSRIDGVARFRDTPKGVRVSVELRGLPPGKHGIHVHEKASCADKGAAAGSHYNPKDSPHGLLLRDGEEKAHGGDFGNITAQSDGRASLELTIPGAKADAFEGRALVVHEKVDDFSQPSGNAGGRIACGVIE